MLSSVSTSFEIVVLPAPESPVNQRVKPLSLAMGKRRSSFFRLAVSVDQDLGDLGPAELVRRDLAVAEHLADLGPAEEDVSSAS